MKTDAHWEKIGKFHHHGIVIPLFSLHSKNSCGIGEFLDLIPLIDWCKDVGFDVIQLLPLNDSGRDPSPYNPLSSSALDPIYLSLTELGIDFAVPKPIPHVIRSEVLEIKTKLLFEFFEKNFEEDALKGFCKEHPWVESYAQFKALKDQNGQKHCQFYTFLQFHAFRQMEMVKKYADQKGIKLKGDVPILISQDSADVWANPTLFNRTLVAGAPPDHYFSEGQKWGFPLFNWEAMGKNGYAWWKQRLGAIEKLYHIYRIDHVVGFFRIWGIPKKGAAKEGSFFPPDHHLWEAAGKKHLEMMIEASPLLPMAEDLGTIPKDVYTVLKELGICGTKVMRWEKSEKGFIPLNEYEPISMTTVSTHDMDPLGLWWKKYPTEASSFAHFLNIPYMSELTAKERLSILTAAHHTSSLFHINPLQEYLALFEELVHLNPEEERINHPGTQLLTNWIYRFRPSVEELIHHAGLKKAIKSLLREKEQEKI